MITSEILLNVNFCNFYIYIFYNKNLHECTLAKYDTFCILYILEFTFLKHLQYLDRKSEIYCTVEEFDCN